MFQLDFPLTQMNRVVTLRLLFHKLLTHLGHLLVQIFLDTLYITFEGHTREHEFTNFHRIFFLFLLLRQPCQPCFLLCYPFGFCLLFCYDSFLFFNLFLDSTLLLFKCRFFLFYFQKCIIIWATRLILIGVVLGNFAYYVQVFLITDNTRWWVVVFIHGVTLGAISLCIRIFFLSLCSIRHVNFFSLWLDVKVSLNVLIFAHEHYRCYSSAFVIRIFLVILGIPVDLFSLVQILNQRGIRINRLH